MLNDNNSSKHSGDDLHKLSSHTICVYLAVMLIGKMYIFYLLV
jgi:hypothetical protein